MRCLQSGYKHNKVTLRTFVTPNVIRYLLTMQDIKTIDFSEAEMDYDVEIDLGFKMVVDKDVDIIPNEHIYVVGK